jgi:hypothetical protein
MFRQTARKSVLHAWPASIEAFAPKPSDDKRALSIFANGAYY